ncbi:MAG: panthothenate synthetase [Candidatus Omnitrophica bacterium]|nr:panthothenate synthetase [Candidatus Omnitrophota bacterium]
MRMLVHVRIPHQPFNAYVQEGSIGSKMDQILKATKAEAVYFTEYDGQRGAVLIVEVENPSKVPSLAEPWFLLFNADVQFHIVMKPEDLASAGLDAIGKKWSSLMPVAVNG